MVGGLVFFIIFILVIAAIIKDGLFIVKQQHAVIIERLGKFNRFVGAGFHVKIPFFERKATTVSLRTMKNGFSIDVKTEDNVTIGLDISAQYHVDYSLGNNPMESGIFKSYYTSHPGAGEGPKGWAVRPLKWHASWVQNVVRQFGLYLSWAWEFCVVPSLVREDRDGQTSGLPVVPPGAPLGI